MRFVTHAALVTITALCAAMGAQAPVPFLVSSAGGSAQTAAGASGVQGATFGPMRVASDDGRYLVFTSTATDLVAGQNDSNAATDVFLYDQQAGAVKLVSHAAGASTTACNAGTGSGSVFVSISADGAWVAFSSSSTDLVAGLTDTNGLSDTFLYETATGNVTLASRSAASATTTGNARSSSALIDGTGRYVAYLSLATDLVSGLTETNSVDDIYLYDRVTGTNRLVSHAAGSTTTTGTVPAGTSGSNRQMFSDSGHLVFCSEANNLVSGVTDSNNSNDLFFYDIATDTVTLISHLASSATTTASGTCYAGLVSANGAYVVFHHNSSALMTGQTDTNNNWDVFLWERASNTTRLVSHLPGSSTTASTTTTPSGGPALPGPSRVGSLSADGRYLAYVHDATDLVSGQTGAKGNAFLYDRLTDTNTLVSRVAGSATQTVTGFDPWVSADGQRVAFTTPSDTVISSVTDTNGARDAFVFERSSGNLLLVSRTVSSANNTGNGTGTRITWAGNGMQLYFTSAASDMGPTDNNGTNDVFGVSLGAYVSSIAPASGSIAGGNTVTFSGHGLGGVTQIRFGGVAATNLTINSDTSATAVAPAHAVGAVNVELVTAFMTVTVTNGYSYANTTPPTVAGVSPGTGPVAGGTAVTITGTNFIGATGVTFGGVAAATFSVVSASTITATTPAHAAGAVSVVVTTPSGNNSANTLFTYLPAAPTVAGVTPGSGSTVGGTGVTITGTGFSGATSVTFGGATATFAVVSSTTITATTPAHAPGAVSVVVTNAGGSNAANTLFTYIAPPTLGNVSPASGPTTGGTSVTLTGTSFTGATSVSFDGLAATNMVILSATQITCTTPAHAVGPVSVIVTNQVGSNAANTAFSYTVPAPTVSGVNPASGPITGGTSVSVTGTNFVNVIAVSFGGVNASSVNVSSSTALTCTAPAHAAGTVSVEVTTATGASAANSLFTYFVPATPQEIDVTRGGAPIAVGSTDTLNGAVAGTALAQSYTISNTGGTSLQVTVPVTITGASNCIVNVTQQPVATVAAGGTTTLGISVTPNSAGPFSFSVSVLNDDADEGVYTWQVSGTAGAMPIGPGPNGGGSGGGGGGCAAQQSGAWAMIAALVALLAVAAVRRRAA